MRHALSRGVEVVEGSGRVSLTCLAIDPRLPA